METIRIVQKTQFETNQHGSQDTMVWAHQQTDSDLPQSVDSRSHGGDGVLKELHLSSLGLTSAVQATQAIYSLFVCMCVDSCVCMSA